MKIRSGKGFERMTSQSSKSVAKGMIIFFLLYLGELNLLYHPSYHEYGKG